MSPQTPYLDPLNSALAAQFAAGPPIQDLSIKRFRAFFEKLQKPDHSIPGVTRTSFTVPFEAGLKTFIFKPDSAAKGDVLPVVFYFHGGGWISGTVDSYDTICRDIARQTGYAVVFPAYTLAPEAQYPTQQEQCYAAVKWVREHGHSKELDEEKFAIVSDSAGGQLSVATTILCSTRSPKIPIAYQVLLHPVTDTVLTDNETRSEFLFFNGPVLTMPFTSNVIEDYIPKASDRQSELASPLKISAAHAKLQPPTLIINSSADLLRSEGSAFGEILQQQGIECVVLTGHGQVHDSEVLEATRTGPTPKLVIRVVVGEIVRVLGAKEEGKRKRTVREESEEAEVEAESEGNEDQGTKTRKRKRTRGSS